MLVSFLLLEYRVLHFCILNGYAIYPDNSVNRWISLNAFTIGTQCVTAILFYGSIQAINSVNLELLRIFSILHAKVTKPVVRFVEIFWNVVYFMYVIGNLISVSVELSLPYSPTLDVLKVVHFIIFILGSKHDGICFRYSCHGYG